MGLGIYKHLTPNGVKAQATETSFPDSLLRDFP